MNKNILERVLLLIIEIETIVLFVLIINKVADTRNLVRENQEKLQNLETKLQKIEINYKLYELDFCQWDY